MPDDLNFDDLPGLKREDFRRCDVCGESHKGSPVFYVVELQQAVLDPDAVREFAGLETMLGEPALANMFSSYRHIAKLLPPTRLIVCQECFLKREVVLAGLWDQS